MNNIEHPSLEAIQHQAALFDMENITVPEIEVVSFVNGTINLQGKNKEGENWLEYSQTLAARNYYAATYALSVKFWPDFKNVITAHGGKWATATPKIGVDIFRWTSAPEYLVKKDAHFFLLLVHRKCEQYPGASIPSIRDRGTWKEDVLYNKYEVSFSDAVALLDFLQKEEKLSKRKTKWDEDALKEAETRLKEKVERDAIIVDGKADFIENPFVGLNAEGAMMQLKDYQKVAIAFADISNGCIINADQVGLGKTLDAIGYAVRHNFRTLIVTKASLSANIRAEIKKLTGREALILKGEIPTEFDMRALMLQSHQFVVINYTILGKETVVGEEDDEERPGKKKPIKKQLWADLLLTVHKAAQSGDKRVKGFDLIIADEAHLIRNMESSRSRAVRSLSQAAPRRMALTATPVVNGTGDYFPLLSFIRPDVFPSYAQFLNTYTLDGRYPKNERQLQELLKSFLIRRTKKDVMKELPPISRIDQVYSLSDEARERYTKAELGVYEVLKTFDPEKHGSEFQINGVLAMLIRLKQIVAEDKIDFTGDLAREINESAIDAGDSHPKVIIFSQFVPVVRRLAKYLGYEFGEALFITGEDHNSGEKKLAVVNKFMQDKKVQFLVCSTDAASEGLNITAAGTVIFNDLMWTPASHEQAEGRAYGRLNDPHPIDSYYILGEDTIDAMIYKILHRKWRIIDTVVDGVERERVKGMSVGGELIRALKERMGR